MELEGNWHDLTTRGFVVVRGLLAPAALQRFVDDYRSVPANATSTMPAMMVPCGQRVADELRAPVGDVVATIRRHTDLGLTEFERRPCYFRTTTGSFDWHTDAPPYFLFQNMYQYTNLWIPIVKARKDISGMSVVPMDVLSRRDADMFDAVVGRGACFMVPADVPLEDDARMAAAINQPTETAADKVLIFEREGRFQRLVPKVSLDEIAVTPDIAPGDAIIARGDVLHRTQDRLTDRVAISLRAVNGDLEVRRDFWRGLSTFTRRRLATPKHYLTGKFFGAFAHAGKDTILARELIDFMDGVDAADPSRVALLDTIAPTITARLGLVSA